MTTDKYSSDDDMTNNLKDRAEVVPRQGISIVWFVPLIALIFGGWLGIKALSERGTFITIEFENGAGIIPRKTEVRYKGLVTGVVTKVVPSKNLESVIAEVEMHQSFSNYLTEKTKFWLVSADISLQGVSGLDTLLSGSYINILPDISKDADSADHFVALTEAPQLDMASPGLHISLLTNVLGSISENSPVTFKQIPIGYVTGYHYLEKSEQININIFVKEEYAHLVKENSLFWNTSGVQFTASLATGIKVNTDSISSIIAGGIAVDTLSYQDKKAPAKNGQVFPLHADFQSAEMGHEIELVFGWDSGIDNNAAILYQGVTIGTVVSINKIDPKTRKITAKAHVNPRVIPYLTDESQFYLVSPKISLNGISNAKTLITGTYISIRPSLNGTPTNKFKVFHSKPPYKYSEPGLHLVIKSHDRHSLQVGSNIYYKEQQVGSIQAIKTVEDQQHLIYVHIKPEFQHHVTSSSHFYNNSGISIKANLQGVDIKAQSLQSILTGGISFINNDEETATKKVENGDIFTLFDNQALAEQRVSFTLVADMDEGIKDGTRILYRGQVVGAIHHIEVQGNKQLLQIGILSKYENILSAGTQFWLAKPELSLSGATDTEALLGGSYITFTTDESTQARQTKFVLLTAPPAKPASAAGLQLSLLAETANVATAGSSVSYRGIVVGQVDNVQLSKTKDSVQVNITIDDEYKSLIKTDTRFYNASGITVSGGLSDFAIKTESVDAILRGGISFYNTEDTTTPILPVKELASFHLFDHIEQAKNAGLAIQIHFNDYSGLKRNTKVLYQEQTMGSITRLIFSDDQVGVTALVLLNDQGAKYAKKGSQFWVVEPEIGLVGSKNVTSILDGAAIHLLPNIHSSEKQTNFEALSLPPTIKELPYGLNLKLTAQRLGSVRVGDPVLFRQVKVGEVIGTDLSKTADKVDVFINIADRYKSLVNEGSKFWNTSGINIEAGIFSGVKVDSESMETLLAGGIAFATPELDQAESTNQLPEHFKLYQNLDHDWLEWQPKLAIEP